jgi:hypothetical protein
MGMDLHPVKSEPFIQPSLHYNWCGWRTLVKILNENGVDTSEFSGINDGELISIETCREVAIVIEDNRKRFEEIYKWNMDNDINFWRHCGGCYQY